MGSDPTKMHINVCSNHRGIFTKDIQHIVDIDLKNFFDEVNHSLLLQLLYNKVKCRTTLRLIRKWLRAPILIKGKLINTQKRRTTGQSVKSALIQHHVT